MFDTDKICFYVKFRGLLCDLRRTRIGSWGDEAPVIVIFKVEGSRTRVSFLFLDQILIKDFASSILIK
jgi:hypothetical protein